MLLTISASRSDVLDDASDLGFLLHKHPDRLQKFDVHGGQAHVFYPESGPERCTAALLLEIDPIALVRGKGRHFDGFSLAQYVNDRPYAASSLLSVAMGKVFRTALSGRCESKQELADADLPLTIAIPAVPGGSDLVTRLFAPMGWTVDAETLPLDPEVPDWGDSSYVRLRLTGTMRLAAALNHLYVLLPVLDDAKHYWVSDDEVDKLLRAGAGWLAEHPERELISRRYLAHQRSMTDEARTRLAELDGEVVADVEETERPRPLVALRHDAVISALTEARPASVVDLGCGPGALIGKLLDIQGIDRVIGTEVSDAALRQAARRLHVDAMTERQADRLSLWLSSLQYQDARLTGLDAAVLMEVIEHIDPERVPAVTANVFGFTRPRTVVVTTPNAEHNVRYEALAAGAMRHPDHRFEWTRSEFASWAAAAGEAYGYTVEHRPVGPVDDEVGPATQLALFTRTEVAS
ncbi:3' terminal RNA ribose 2'-O-methyltransferase Hen1 [Aeromicrobium sp. Root236]|uniref:3' terminal RNA ribose 2'-O-methyltransferase Hen1 n=1 Tax=Aeromicrobium sp. Root236 TaxID=1736498 RepID=UPI0006FAC272|nr:3' terminal RNA ribose 2'-O-methyltransferase Hen1 [Aeromicrobium sp. Root236]KRC66380.1 3' terminal RNA ribose 2'-O-methyltransferase Hen1 [Aeromicrobium sp. Root236]